MEDVHFARGEVLEDLPPPRPSSGSPISSAPSRTPDAIAPWCSPSSSQGLGTRRREAVPYVQQLVPVVLLVLAGVICYKLSYGSGFTLSA